MDMKEVATDLEILHFLGWFFIFFDFGISAQATIVDKMIGTK